MNNTTKIIAATLLAVASSVSLAGTEFASLEEILKVGDKIEDGYLPHSTPGTIGILSKRRVAIQFNVRSTNKSQYNAVYLDNFKDRIDVNNIIDV